MKFNYSIKSPLRYPGGKTRGLKTIIPLVPEFDEYREPFVGGGSVFFSIRQTFSNKIYWINDLNEDLVSFWKESQDNLYNLVDEVRNIKENTKDGKALYRLLKNQEGDLAKFDRAVKFFVLNRITFSGTVEAGGYTQGSFEKRFTDSSIERLSKIDPVLEGVRITKGDYKELVYEPGKDVFIFLDPPYFAPDSDRLYYSGTDRSFNHEEFADVMKDCKHKWLITYDNSDKVIELFDFAYIKEWSQSYGMNSSANGREFKKNELLISNYPLKIPNQEKLI